MSKIFLCLGLFCLLQSAYGRTTREAPAATTEAAITFNEIVKQTDDALKTLQTQFLNFWGVKSNTELTNLIQTQTKTYSDRIQVAVNELSEEAKKSKVSDLFKGYTDKLTAQIDEWKTKNPEFYTETQKYQESFQNSLKGVAEETKKFNEKLLAEGEGMSGNLQKLVQQIYDNTLQAANAVSTQVEAAVKKD